MDADHAILLARFQRAQAQVTDLVDAVAAGQWDLAALPGWTVADLVAHLVTGQREVAPLLSGAPGPAGGWAGSTDDVLAPDPLVAWEDAADEALTACAEPEALGRTVTGTGGPVTGAVLLEQRTAELVVHAWDLARATGADEHLDDELVTSALDVVERDLRPGGTAGRYAAAVEVAPGSPALAQLLARTGRAG